MILFLIRLVAQLLLVILLQLLPALLFALLWAITFIVRFLFSLRQPWREERARRLEEQTELFTQSQRERYKRRVVRG